MAQLLPRRLRQARAEYQRQQLQQKHHNCTKEYRVVGPHIGVYCCEHGNWLRWMPKSQ
jgi:hypothetical protein